ncbi:hypothetical protein K466DRAFT_499153 [Polyporus arcularius HHB13444]|uniref:Ubiquitin-like protease family profile domain-containing protein n=1 Tax=Polyporus arcularius HHB13444 TaxID=1314778 RepID=A0A5C3P447_9APHY|nr:hypothetical protein K466DRAFT_499153 [Polyporus arcularius HHB13444]
MNKRNTIVDDVRAILATVPWAGLVRGFDNGEPLHQLATYATRRWFSDVHENQLLDLLRLAVGRHPEGRRTEVENIAFWKFLVNGYQKRAEGTYQEARHFLRPRGVGEALERGIWDQVGFIVNLHNTHWVSICVDFPKSKIFYGDSMPGSSADPYIVEVLNWWISCHSEHAFTWEMMDITYQNDVVSCGLLSWNGLAHHLLPNEFPLIPASEVQDARLRLLVEIMNRHLDHVSNQKHCV